MSRTAAASDVEKTYLPKRRKLIVLAIVGITLGALGGIASYPDAAAWIRSGTFRDIRAVFVAFVGAPVFVLGGLLSVYGALRGLPRLTVTQRGVSFDYLFGNKWAEWGSLGAFRLAASHVGRSKRRILSATSDIVGTAASGNLLRKKVLTIPDAFLVPIADLIEELNSQRAGAVGIAPAPDASAGPANQPISIGVPGFKVPWLTLAILGVLCAAFGCELVFALEPSSSLVSRPSVATLIALGGVSRSLVLSTGEWYRLFTAPLLHADLAHLFFNGVALFMAGALLEGLVGRVWFLAFFVIGALGGSLASITVNPATLVSVGASGAIMGLLAAAMTSSFRLPAGTARSRIQVRSLQFLIPSLLPLATTTTSGHVDYGAHFGGALSGGLAALLMLKTWVDHEPLPRYRRLAAGFAVAGAVFCVASLADAASHYHRYKVLASLIPQSQLPKSQDEGVAQSKDLVARYPQDPRSHLYRATSLIGARDYASAESELRTALKQSEDLRFFLGTPLENAVRVLLTAILVDQGRRPEAKEIARALCQASDRPSEKILKLLADQRLCD